MLKKILYRIFGPHFVKATNVEAYIIRLEFADRPILAQRIPIDDLNQIIREIYGQIGAIFRTIGGRATALDIGDILIAVVGDINQKEALAVVDCLCKCESTIADLLAKYHNAKPAIHVGIAYGTVTMSTSGDLSAIGVPVLRANGAKKIALTRRKAIITDPLVGNTLGWKSATVHSDIMQSFDLKAAYAPED